MNLTVIPEQPGLWVESGEDMLQQDRLPVCGGTISCPVEGRPGLHRIDRHQPSPQLNRPRQDPAGENTRSARADEPLAAAGGAGAGAMGARPQSSWEPVARGHKAKLVPHLPRLGFRRGNPAALGAEQIASLMTARNSRRGTGHSLPHTKEGHP
jgi:hypothetical protein